MECYGDPRYMFISRSTLKELTILDSAVYSMNTVYLYLIQYNYFTVKSYARYILIKQIKITRRMHPICIDQTSFSSPSIIIVNTGT